MTNFASDSWTSLRKSDGRPRKLRVCTHEVASMRQARSIMAAQLGQAVPHRLVVHHRDNDHFNNRLENLALVTHWQHWWLHLEGATRIALLKAA